MEKGAKLRVLGGFFGAFNQFIQQLPDELRRDVVC
jgi:hypothetical protein